MAHRWEKPDLRLAYIYNKNTSGTLPCSRAFRSQLCSCLVFFFFFTVLNQVLVSYQILVSQKPIGTTFLLNHRIKRFNGLKKSVKYFFFFLFLKFSAQCFCNFSVFLSRTMEFFVLSGYQKNKRSTSLLNTITTMH